MRSLSSDAWIFVALSFAGVTILLLWFELASFEYSFSREGLRLKWRVVGIPVRWGLLRWADIREARLGSARDLVGAYPFGRLVGGRKVVLLLRRRRLVVDLWRKVVLTPKNPKDFVHEVNERMRSA